MLVSRRLWLTRTSPRSPSAPHGPFKPLLRVTPRGRGSPRRLPATLRAGRGPGDTVGVPGTLRGERPLAARPCEAEPPPPLLPPAAGCRRGPAPPRARRSSPAAAGTCGGTGGAGGTRGWEPPARLWVGRVNEKGPPRPGLEAEHGQERAPEVRAEPKASSRGLGTVPREPRRELLRGFGAGRLGRCSSAFPRSFPLSSLCLASFSPGCTPCRWSFRAAQHPRVLHPFLLQPPSEALPDRGTPFGPAVLIEKASFNGYPAPRACLCAGVVSP